MIVLLPGNPVDLTVLRGKGHPRAQTQSGPNAFRLWRSIGSGFVPLNVHLDYLIRLDGDKNPDKDNISNLELLVVGTMIRVMSQIRLDGDNDQKNVSNTPRWGKNP